MPEAVRAPTREVLDPSPLKGVRGECATLDHPVWKEIAPELKPEDFRFPGQMDVHFLRLLSSARRLAGVPFRIVSDARDPQRNRAAGGASKSAHMEEPCRAVDLHVENNFERSRVLTAAFLSGFRRVGIYPAKEDNSGSLHLDASSVNPSPRVWTRY